MTSAASGERPARRGVRRAFWVVLSLSGIAAIFLVLVFAWPHGEPRRDAALIEVPAALVPAPGDDPVRVAEGHFWLVNLAPGEGTHDGFGVPGPGGLLALWQRDPHLGCTVPWEADFRFSGELGWFRNPCHGEIYTKAGVRVFGPAPRSLDTFELRVKGDGDVIVDPRVVTLGDDANALRAVPYPLER